MKSVRRSTPGLFHALLCLACVAAACSNDVSIDDPYQGLDLSPPDFWTPPMDATASGGTNGYGSSSGGMIGEDVRDASPDVPIVPCDEVTFEYQGSANSVLVTGSFTGWATTESQGARALTEAAPGAWSLTTVIDAPGQHFYKLIVDDAWIADPANTQGSPDHLGGQNSVIDVCEPLPEQPCGTVHFAYDDPDALGVRVAGDFTAPMWADGALDLERSSGRWRLTTTIEPGEYQYKFIVTGPGGAVQWNQDPNNPETVDDLNGGFNSALNIACESSCGDVTAFDWRDTVMYFAMVDRFYDSDGQSDPVPNTEGNNGVGATAQYIGGDLAGVTARMNYLADLGVTALWLSAPYENRDTSGKGLSDDFFYSAYHGYWPSPANTDYSGAAPDPRPEVETRILASSDGDAELRALIDAAHQADSANGHGIKVLFDYVMNHVDIDSPLYQAHPDWFARDNGQIKLCGSDCGGQQCWDDDYWTTRCAFTDYLPPFDFYNAAARAWSVDDAIWWATEYGIDGYRLDAIKHVPFEWLTELRSRLNDTFPEPVGGRFYLVGETFTWGDRDLLRDYVNPATMLDGQFDFPFRAQLCEAVLRNNMGLDSFEGWLRENERFYGPDALMSTWVGNHDIPRVIHTANAQFSCTDGSNPGNGWSTSYSQPTGPEPYERLRVAFAVMLTNPGLPLIYYGDEIGLAGGGDPDNRRAMIWDDAQLNSHQIALRDSVRTLARIRGEHRAITRGKRSNLELTSDTWVYRLGGCGDDADDIVVAINRADQSREVNIPAGTYTDLSSDGSHGGGATSLPARSYLVLRVE